MAAFCRRNAIPASSFFAWKRRLSDVVVAPAFVEAKIAARGPGAGVIEVRLRGGRRVRVCRDGFDRDLLTEVVAVLEGLS